MTQEERRLWLLQALLAEQPQAVQSGLPADETGRTRLLRALFNVRKPLPVTDAFLHMQDAYLQEEIRRKGITRLSDLEPLEEGLYLWRGDITTLQVDAIVNAANSSLLGCFVPCHTCIDNAIHTFAGVQLRLACAALTERQGVPEPAGQAKITPVFNLPSRFVLHTVGPVIYGDVTQQACDALASCYRSCLVLAQESGCKSIAFCCISTGEFHFPNEQAARIAIESILAFRAQTKSKMQVVCNVYKQLDDKLYRRFFRAP